MVINPIQEATIKIGNIISADSLSCGISDSSNGNTGILDYKVYDTVSKLDFIEDNNFYYLSSFADLKIDLNKYKTDVKQISHGSIISGNGTYNWLEYCYEQLSRLRYCKFYYKNSDYLSAEIFSDIPYTNISYNHVLLSDNKLSMTVTKNNDVPYDNNISNFIKIDGGISASYNFATEYYLDKFTGVNELSNQFKKGEIIYSKTVNDTIDKYHSIFVLNGTNSNGSKLSCVFSNAPGFNCKDDNYKIFLHFALYAFTSKDDAISKFKFAGDSIIFDNVQFNNLQLNGSAFIKKYLYENVNFSMNSLGILDVNFTKNYTIKGWFCVRTSSDNISNAIATLKKYVTINGNAVNIETKDNIFQYYKYDSKLIKSNNFNEICDKTIDINLGNNEGQRTHYWLFPYMSGEKVAENCYCPLNGYAPGGGTSDNKKNSATAAEAVMDKDGKYLEANLSTKYYGIYYSNGHWNLISSKTDLDTYMDTYPYDTYPISKIYRIRTHARYGGNFKDSVVKHGEVKIGKQTYYLVDNFYVKNLKTYYTTSSQYGIQEVEMTHDAVRAQKQSGIVKWIDGQPTWSGKRLWRSGQSKTIATNFSNFNSNSYIKFSRSHDANRVGDSTKSSSAFSDSSRIFANAVIKTYQINSYPQI